MSPTGDTGKIHLPINTDRFLDGPFYENRKARRDHRASLLKRGAGFTRQYRKGRTAKGRKT